MGRKNKAAAADAAADATNLDDNLESEAAAGPSTGTQAQAPAAAADANGSPAEPEKKKRGRVKQERLPGMEEPTIPDVEQAAEEYREIRDQRMKLQKDEGEAHDKLVQNMHKHGRTVYEFDGYKVELVTTEKARVRREKDDTDDDSDED